MKILIIGAAGFLGSRLFRTLSESTHGHDVFGLSSTIADDSTGSISKYQWPGNSISDALYRERLTTADIIIYCAGAGIQPKEKSDEASIFNLNLYEPARLVKVLAESGFEGQLITFGSYFETGINQIEQLVDEVYFLKQNNELPNDYCRAKKSLTLLHHIYQHVSHSFKWLHLVLTNIYGVGENENRLIPYIIAQSMAGHPLHFTSGEQIRQYTLIQDVVEIVSLLLGKASGLYHVTNPETNTVKDIILETVRQVKSELNIQPELYFDLDNGRDTSMEYLAINPGKLNLDWGLQCTTGYKKGISLYFT